MLRNVCYLLIKNPDPLKRSVQKMFAFAVETNKERFARYFYSKVLGNGMKISEINKYVNIIY